MIKLLARGCVVLAGLCLSGGPAVSAEPARWELAPGLTIAPMENFRLEPQSLEQWGIERALVGSVGDGAGYFIAAQPAEPLRRRQQWAALEKQLRKSAEDGLTELFRGQTRLEGGRAPYRAYRYRRDGAQTEQLYHLIEVQGRPYWLYATAVAPLALEKLLPVTEAVIRRVRH